MQKTVAILGATGSVGMQALSVAQSRGYKIDFMTADKNVKDMESYARKFLPSAVAMADADAASDLKHRLADTSVQVLCGDSGIVEGIEKSKSETVLNAIIGKAGLIPTLAVIDSKKRLALANKESLVVAGEIVMSRAAKNGAEIIPVDSEHSAIFQSLSAGKRSEIKRLILTASGGPFFGKTKEELKEVTLAQTLAHPTWKMGKKITVDSATLMNKGFEVIEAAHLFDVGVEKIDVVVHRESILHSAVEYIDNTVIGEFSVPEMRMCVQYAVDYPNRLAGDFGSLDLIKCGKLSFFAPDTEAFPLLALAARAMSLGGAMPAILNAADEVAVDAFLKEQISFFEISEVVSSAFERMVGSDGKTLEEILYFDKEARKITKNIIEEK